MDFIRYFKTIFFILLFFSIIGCSPRIYEQVSSVGYRADTRADTLFIRDSIYIDRIQTIKEKNDTVYITDYQTIYKDKIISHTKTDTLYVTKEILNERIVEKEKELNKWQKFRLDGFWILLSIVILTIWLAICKLVK